jgi:hypothetical protein
MSIQKITRETAVVEKVPVRVNAAKINEIIEVVNSIEGRIGLPNEDVDDLYFGDYEAGNYTTYDSDGHFTMYGNARPWRDQISDAISLQESGPGVSRNTTDVTVDYTHASNLSDFMYLNIQLNHDKDMSSNIYPHIHWLQSKNYSPNFLLAYRWQKNGSALTSGWTYLKCNLLAFTYVSGTLNQISYAGGITVPVGSKLSDIVQFKIYRDNANTSGEFTGIDPYNTGGNAITPVLSVDVHFMINSFGSNEEYVK